MLSVNNDKPAGVSLPGEPRAEPHPYAADKAAAGNLDGPPADVMYRYRRWKLAADISVVARTSIHAVSRKSG